ncbi:hypothetical protein QTP86_029096 [Hemibagrus guttatus]|nr:hypothetical protein QTP86_029096 [Hemibagrus guttatus]
MKSAKEKKRKHSRRESADGDRKRRSTESSMGDPKEERNHVQEVKEEQSDIEEGGLDLTVPFKPINAYLNNRQEMLEQCFHVLGQNKLKKMLPDELKECSFTEIRTLCWDQLQKLSESNLLQILEGKEVTANSEAEEKETNRTSADSHLGDDPFLFQHDCTPVHKASSIKTRMSEFGVEELDWPAQSPDLNPIEHLWDELEWRLRARPSRPTSVSDLTNALLEERQDNSVDSTSSMKENAEGEDKQGLSGEESDVLSINADMNDSDIEGHKDPKPQEEQISAPTVTPSLSSAPTPEADLQSDEPKLELQRDIDRSVSEILALTDCSSDEAQLKLRSQQVALETAPASFPVPPAAPSAQQLALLELEMRARAIKALMKANEVKK